ncbi:DNA repair protein RecO [Helcococcus sueciensis]|uniref:DNA repair protein RecO n=1 Tax=Helcococcus sueciensis TaxID=241555 RepID=UPI0004822F16|nr:DNA repair protein RecO [Helcococcus sueciensis]
MDTFNIEAIVFRSTDYGETSKILTLFSLEEGIITLMAKGVKNPKSKKQNLVSPFTIANFEINKSHNFYYLKDGEIISNNYELRKDIGKIYITQLFFDIIENTSIKNEKNEIVYLLLKKTLQYLENSKNQILILNIFLIKYISMIGYKPRLFNCVKCGKNKFKEVYFSCDKGGILCENDMEFNSIRLNQEEYEYLCRILLEVYENIDIIHTGEFEKKILKLLMDFIIYNTGINVPASYKMVSKIIGIK